VVAITDIAVDRPPKGHLSYTTAKGALQTMMLALANDWAPHVRFNVVQPGTLPFPEHWHDEERARKIQESIPLGRLGTYEDLAGAVVYLALDATYVTGQVLAVDGGRSRQLY
jgi:pteridine reductase